MLFLLLYRKKNDILFEHCKTTVVAQHFYLCSSASSKEGWGEWGRQLEVSWQRTAWALREVTAEIRGSNLTQIFHFTLLCSESVQGEEVVIQGYESLLRRVASLSGLKRGRRTSAHPWGLHVCSWPCQWVCACVPRAFLKNRVRLWLSGQLWVPIFCRWPPIPSMCMLGVFWSVRSCDQAVVSEVHCCTPRL